MSEQKLKIGITQGDPNGIGWEVILKALADPRMTELFTPVVYGSPKAAAYYRNTLAQTEPVQFNAVTSARDARRGKVNLVACGDTEQIEPGKASAEAGRAAVEALRRAAGDRSVVIPGFYGVMPGGRIKTFSRGGSDITGAIVARAVGADLYENWTDVSGFLMTDPRIVPNPRTISKISYRELRELSYMGASVLHEDSIFPVQKGGIPINVKNTNDPEHPGTMILAEPEDDHGCITGIAGKKGFTIIHLEKDKMNSELGFGRRVLSVFEELGISFEHLPSGIDTLSVVISDKQLNGHKEEVVRRLREVCSPDRIEVVSNLALIATVGHGMVRRVGIAAMLFTALAEAGVNVRMIDQGSSELSILVGVATKISGLILR